MIKINDKKTAIVGGIVGLVILLTIFCCEGKKEAVEAARPTKRLADIKDGNVVTPGVVGGIHKKW